MLSLLSRHHKKRLIRNIATQMNKRDSRYFPVITPIINIMDDMLEEDEILYLSQLDSIANKFGPKILKPNQEVLLYHSESDKRVIPVDRAVSDPVYEIHPHKTINALIEERSKTDAIYTIGCVCRNIQKKLNNPCSLGIPVEDSCLFFGDRGFGYTVKQAGYGRKISREEAIDILQGMSCCPG